MNISRILALGGSICGVLRGSEALGGSICRVLRGSEALGGSFVHVLRVGEALGGAQCLTDLNQAVKLCGSAKERPHVRGDHMGSYGCGIIWNHVGSCELM